MSNGSSLEATNYLNKLAQTGEILSQNIQFIIALNPELLSNKYLVHPELKKLYQINLCIYDLDIPKAKALYNDTLKTFLESEYLSEFHRLNLVVLNNDSTELLEYIYNYDIELKDETEYFGFLKLLYDFAYYQTFNSNTEFALCIVDYILNLIDSGSYENNFSIIKTDCLILKLLEFLEIDVDEQKIDDLVTIIEKRIESEKRPLKKMQISQLKGINNPKYYLNLTADSILQLDISGKDKIFLLIDHGFQRMDSQPEKAIPYFINSLKLTKGNCNSFRNYIHCLLGLVYENMDVESESDFHFNLAKDETNCNELEIAKINFYNIMIRMGYSDRSLKQLSEIQKFKKYSDQRKYSIKSFGSVSDHYDDFYIQNVTNSLEVFKNSTIYDQSIYLQILNLLSSSRIREAKRKKFKDEQSSQEAQNSEINILKRKYNSYYDIKNFQDNGRRKLFKLVLEDYMTDDKNPIRVIPDKFDKDDVGKFIGSKTTGVIDYMRYGDKMFACIIKDQEIRINIIDAKLLDSLANDFDFMIRGKFYNRNIIKRLGEVIFPMDLSDVDSLIIIPNSTLDPLPLHLLSTKSVKRFVELSRFLESAKCILDKTKAVFLSYSDSVSLNSKNIRKIPELKYGLIECESINQNLRLNHKILAGNKMTRQELVSSLKSDILHISSHAYSNKENRLDNYLLLRNTDYSLDTVYTYEIKGAEKFPILAVLSACESGLGKHVNGKGTYDIARAFINNGSQAVIKSLWKVNDISTQVFMVELYRQWDTGISLDDALKNTRTYMKTTEYKHAFYWAGFILDGNGQLYLK